MQQRCGETSLTSKSSMYKAEMRTVMVLGVPACHLQLYMREHSKYSN